jgi:hypothetical protein
MKKSNEFFIPSIGFDQTQCEDDAMPPKNTSPNDIMDDRAALEYAELVDGFHRLVQKNPDIIGPLCEALSRSAMITIGFPGDSGSCQRSAYDKIRMELCSILESWDTHGTPKDL